MTSQIPRILLGAVSLQPGSGGIARLARLMAKVLGEEQRAGRLGSQALTLAESGPSLDLDLPVQTARRSRLRYCGMAMYAGLASTHVVFDACHLAQCHYLPILRRRKMLTYGHGIEIWEDTKPRYLNSLRRATCLLFNTDYTLQRAERLHGQFAQARICWLGTETDDVPVAAERSTDRAPEVLIVSRLESEGYKGHRELIRCWHHVVAALPGATLRIVGQGDDAILLSQMATASPARDRIVFQGFVPDEELERLYSQTSVFAMPSRGEGFGLVYVEAMRHGLPVVASVHDAAPEIVIDDKTGYTVNLDKPEELPARLIHLLQNPMLARQMGKAGRDRWRQHFCYSAFRERFRPLLWEFLNSHRQGHSAALPRPEGRFA